MSKQRLNEPNFPRELQYHELEESREFRESRQGGYNDRMGGRPYRVKSKKPRSSNKVDRRQELDDPIERYRPIEYRRPEKKEEEEEPSQEEEEDQYEQFKAKRQARPIYDDPKHY